MTLKREVEQPMTIHVQGALGVRGFSPNADRTISIMLEASEDLTSLNDARLEIVKRELMQQVQRTIEHLRGLRDRKAAP